ncbi:MAG: glycosyltransferase [Patescibacteria group bacterium]
MASDIRMITFVFPAYNEAENLKRFPTEVIPVFDALEEPYEVVVVDDGSVDDTADVASSLGGRVRLVRHDRNRGLGASVRTGIREARGDLIVTMDTDLTFAPSLVPSLLERYRKGDVDCVSGSPKLAGYDRKIPFYRKAISYAATAVYAVVIGAWVRDVSPIFRLYRREQLLELPLETERFEINAEILFHLIRRGRRVVEIPASLTQRIHGESKLDYRKEIVRHMKLVWRMLKMRLFPRRTLAKDHVST